MVWNGTCNISEGLVLPSILSLKGCLPYFKACVFKFLDEQRSARKDGKITSPRTQVPWRTQWENEIWKIVRHFNGGTNNFWGFFMIVLLQEFYISQNYSLSSFFLPFLSSLIYIIFPEERGRLSILHCLKIGTQIFTRHAQVLVWALMVN